MGFYLSKACTVKDTHSKCNDIIAAATMEMQGWRRDMEDAHVLELNGSDTKGVILFGVFDGHGGPVVSAWVARHFLVTFSKSFEMVSQMFEAKKLETRTTETVNEAAAIMAETLEHTFFFLDRQLINVEECGTELRILQSVLDRKKNVYLERCGISTECSESHMNSLVAEVRNQYLSNHSDRQLVEEEEVAPVTKDLFDFDVVYEEEAEKDADSGISGVRAPYDPNVCGCTSVVAAILLEPSPCIVVANAGDSRAVVIRNGYALNMTKDHKPMQLREYKRITQAGGMVVNGRVDGNLNLSRTLGDLAYKQQTELEPAQQRITALPDLTMLALCKEDEFVVLGCDGIWDVLTNQKCADMVTALWAEHTKSLDTPLTAEISKSICEKISASILNHCVADSPYNSANAGGIGCDNMTILVSRLSESFRSDLPTSGIGAKPLDHNPSEADCDTLSEKHVIYYGTEVQHLDYQDTEIIQWPTD